MKFSQLVIIIFLSVISTIVAERFFRPSTQVTALESAYDRVLRTSVLRCGYADTPPIGFVQDAKTGKVSGIFPDIAEVIASRLKLKVEWTENTGLGGAIESLHTHRIDAFCSGLFRNTGRGRYVGYTSPAFYSPVYPYVGITDHRFDKDLSAVNQPNVRISAMDGATSDIIAKNHFPKATEISVPQLGQYTDILLNVANHKADIVFSEPSAVNAYIKSNPNTLRLAQDTPYQFFPVSFAVDIHEPQLQEMLDTAVIELQNQGIIDQIILKYSADTKEFLRVAKPYEMPK